MPTHVEGIRLFFEEVEETAALGRDIIIVLILDTRVEFRQCVVGVLPVNFEGLRMVVQQAVFVRKRIAYRGLNVGFPVELEHGISDAIFIRLMEVGLSFLLLGWGVFEFLGQYFIGEEWVLLESLQLARNQYTGLQNTREV